MIAIPIFVVIAVIAIGKAVGRSNAKASKGKVDYRDAIKGRRL